MKTAPHSAPGSTPRALRRAAKPPAPGKSGTPPALSEAPVDALPGDRGIAKIRLDATNLTPVRTLNQLRRSANGMALTPAYAGLEIIDDLQSAATELGGQLEEIAATRRHLASLLLKLHSTQPVCAALLQRAASACEAADPSPATLVSGGWALRRQPGPPQTMPVPAGLRLRQNPQPGQATARWRTVPNARYYEITLTPAPGSLHTIPAPLTLTSPRASVLLPPVEPGTQLTLTVRAIGAKGPGPDSPGLIVRVN